MNEIRGCPIGVKQAAAWKKVARAMGSIEADMGAQEKPKPRGKPMINKPQVKPPTRANDLQKIQAQMEQGTS